jgi:hypothetical protein
MKSLLAMSLLLLVQGMTLAQQGAESASPKPALIQGSGCVSKAVESSCLVLKDAKTGEIYNLLFADHSPAPDTAIRFRATEHHGMTTCMQGKAVNVTGWKRLKGMKCPAAPAGAVH